jgi:hypothetical protein
MHTLNFYNLEILFSKKSKNYNLITTSEYTCFFD